MVGYQDLEKGRQYNVTHRTGAQKRTNRLTFDRRETTEVGEFLLFNELPPDAAISVLNFENAEPVDEEE